LIRHLVKAAIIITKKMIRQNLSLSAITILVTMIIVFTKSTDGGTTFAKPVNLSNNPGFSDVHVPSCTVGKSATTWKERGRPEGIADQFLTH
jgi:hypothetical protein